MTKNDADLVYIVGSDDTVTRVSTLTSIPYFNFYNFMLLGANGIAATVEGGKSKAGMFLN